jgi:GT2 family glycosyltransferase
MTDDRRPGPRFSVLTAVHDPDPAHLEACLASVDAQTLDDWEHVVVDDASTDPAVGQVLARHAGRHRLLGHRPVQGGIVAASSDALARASGELVVLLDHDDVLEPDALAGIAAAIDAEPDPAGVDLVYTDHDLLDPDGRRIWPVRKPSFSLERLRNHNWITHLVVLRRSAVEAAGGFRTGLDGAQDHDLLLRVVERGGAVVRVPVIAAHWRQSPGSVATATANKAHAFDAGVGAVADHLARVGVDATVERGRYDGVYRIHRHVPAGTALAVIVVASGREDLVWGRRRVLVHDAVESLLREAPDGVTLDLTVVLAADAPAVVARGLQRLAGDRLTLVPWSGPPDRAGMLAAGTRHGSTDPTDLLVLLDETALVGPTAVAELVGLALQPDVGMAGAELLADDGRVAHAGYVCHGAVVDAFAGWPATHPGPHRMLCIERECRAVSAVVAVVRRDALEHVGGIDATVGALFDVDLGMRLWDAGYRVVWTPHAIVEVPAAIAHDRSAATAALVAKWGERALTDPFANPDLEPGRGDWLEM